MCVKISLDVRLVQLIDRTAGNPSSKRPNVRISDRPRIVVLTNSLERTDVAADVHIVYVGKEVGAEAAAGIVAAYRGKPVLTVTDVPRGIDAGAALNFVQSDKRVRFDAAPTVAEQSGLHLSSRLLAVAEKVGGTAP